MYRNLLISDDDVLRERQLYQVFMNLPTSSNEILYKPNVNIYKYPLFNGVG